MLSTRMPELTALQMLDAVHRTGSLSAAARELGVSQQAVSARMRALEGLVGVRLLDRSPRGARLTATGALVADWAEEVLDAAERLDAGIASLRADSSRHLTVVASQTLAGHLVPHWLVALRSREEAAGRRPTEVELSVTNSADVLEMVRRGGADLGFIETPERPDDLVGTPIRRDRLVVVVAPGHPWAGRDRMLSAAELAATPLVTRERGSGTRRSLELALEGALSGAGPAPAAVELSTTAAVRSAIAAGVAPGVLSALAVQDDIALGRLVAVPVADLRLERPLSVVWRRTAPPIGAARELIAVATAH